MVWRVLTREKLEETKQEFASSGYVVQWHAMAMEVILTTLGPDWWTRNCTIGAIKPDEFLERRDDSEDSTYNYQDRIVKLGHMLYALKDCKGYEVFITSLKTRDLAPSFFELWVANILQQNGFDIQFVATSGKKGEDYDLTAERDNICLSVEAKSRRDGAVLRSPTMRNTLEKARKQLPSSGPGVIFISIPNEWTMKAENENTIGTDIKTFFRSTARVNYIMLIWHRWISLETGRTSASLVQQYDNPTPRSPIALGKLVKPLEAPITLDPEKQGYKPSFW